jgi:exosortase
MIQQPRLSVVAMFGGIYGLMGLAWGPVWLRRSFFPFFLFIFCLPMAAVAQPITFRLRMLVCQLVEGVSHQILAIEVVRQGTALMDPAGKYSYNVEAACSGLKSQIATFGLAVIYAFMMFQQWWKRGVLILSAFPLAVLGNFLRLMLIIFVADMWGQDAGTYVHDGGPLGLISLIPYVPAFVGLFLLGNWLESRKTAGGIPNQRGNEGGGSVAPNNNFVQEVTR